MEALIIVDVQNDFVPGGAMAVPEGDRVVPIINRLMDRFRLVVATQDWHPSDHGSFAASHRGRKVGEIIDLDGLQQMLRPVHCVEETPGADFVPSLVRARIERVFQKGTEKRIDSYSGFFDNGHRKSTGLADYLKHRGVRDVYIAGLATDYCVRFTASDACELGFNTHLVEDACAGVELKPDDVAAAISELRGAGVHVIRSGQI